MILKEMVSPSEHNDTLCDIERILASIHICAYTVPKICQYTKLNEERTRLLVEMLEKHGHIRRIDEFMWLTEKGEEWRQFLKRTLL